MTPDVHISPAATAPHRRGRHPDVFEQVFEDQRAFFKAAAAGAGIALGLFDRLARPMTCDRLARLIGASAHRLEALLRVLCFEKYLRNDPQENTWQTACDPDQIHTLPETGWGLLAEVIRSDRPLVHDCRAGADSGAARRLHAHLFATGYPNARSLWQTIGIRSGHLLDIGAGAGAYAAAFLARCPDNRATLVDTGPVLALAREKLEPFGSRVRYDAQDALAPLPGDFDTVLLANVLHLYGPAHCARLVSAAARALKPGGCLVIKDIWIENDRSGPAAALYFALNMALYTPGGTVHAPEQVRCWALAAGLNPVTIVDSTPSLVVTGG